MKAETVSTEEARISELRAYGVLDTAAEADFDDVVNLVARLLDVPVALVSLVDEDRQWFKARFGFEVAETPLNQAICAHAILADDLMVVPDTLKDIRTADNPLCCGELADMRFYAGAPLIAPSGHRLGTLCVLDRRPRELTPVQHEVLRVMAAQVMRQLDLRRALAAEEVLRKEIDHRVKNSLQTVESLLRLYKTRSADEQTRAILDAVARRIRSVSELHRALYQSDTVDDLHLDRYLAGILALLEQQAPEGVRLRYDLAPALASTDAAQAVAVIVSEFVANTFKHAFAPGQSGEVFVTLQSDANGLTLTCRDNGRGHTVEGTTGTGIGLRLMEAAADQLGARIAMGSDGAGYGLHLHLPA